MKEYYIYMTWVSTSLYTGRPITKMSYFPRLYPKQFPDFQDQSYVSRTSRTFQGPRLHWRYTDSRYARTGPRHNPKAPRLKVGLRSASSCVWWLWSSQWLSWFYGFVWLLSFVVSSARCFRSLYVLVWYVLSLLSVQYSLLSGGHTQPDVPEIRRFLFCLPSALGNQTGRRYRMWWSILTLQE